MKKWIYNGLIILFAAVFLVSAGALAIYYIGAWQQQSRYDQLAQLTVKETTPRPTVSENDETSPTTPAAPHFVTVTDPDTGEEVTLLPEFQELYLMNNHIVGWIEIPGTNVNYPVMQTPDDPNYYLKRNFDRESSSRGCIYVREECDVFAPSDNITIYGHRMRNGDMFGQLDKYMDAAFCRENPYIYFDTLTGLHTYRVMAVFLTSASAGEGFSYHMFVDAQGEAEFQEFVDTCKALSLYDTGVDATYGDKLITLSTCEYSQVNGRLVIVAKQVN